MNIRYIIFFLLSVFPGFAVYADNVRISGKIIDNEDKPIEFATIRVVGTTTGTNSNLKGQYSLSVAEKDTVELSFSCIGFKTVNHKLIKPKGDLTLNVRLYPLETRLEELEVVGFRKNINGMQSLNTKSFRLSPDVSGGSVEAMITTMPGVHSSNELSSQYSVRGGSFDENSVYINGTEVFRPLLSRSGQQEGMSIINPEMTGNVQFSSGGFPARYSDKMSSVLDITYRDPESFEASLKGSLMGASLTLGQHSGKFSQLHGVRFRKNNSLLSASDVKAEYDPAFFDYQTNLTLKASDRLSFNFLGNIALNHYNFKPHDRETTFGTLDNTQHFRVYFDGHEKDKFETYLGALTMNYRVNRGTNLSLGVSGFLSNELVAYDISGEYWLNQTGADGPEGSNVGNELGVGKYMEHARDRLKSSLFSIFFKGQSRLRNNNLSYGVEYRRESFRDRSKEWEWRDSAGYSLPTQPEGVHLIYNLSSRNNLNSSRIAAYLEDALFFENSKAYMTLNVGVRASYWDFNKEFLVSPRVNFSVTPTAFHNWTYRLVAGMYYQSPFYKEFREIMTDDSENHYIRLNDKIKSPRSIQLVFGTDYIFRMFNRPFKVTGELFYKNMSNLISYEIDNLKVTYSGVNDSKGYSAGIDMKLFGQFVDGSDSWLSVSLMKTQQTLHGKKVPLPNDQRYSVSLYFTDYFPKFPKLKFSLRGILSDGLTLTAPHRSRAESWFRAPAYKRIDVGLSYQLVGAPTSGVRPYNFWRHFKSIEVGFDCFNLLDINNVSNYFWITDVNSNQFAVPNYLTRRQFNVWLSIKL